MKIAILVATLAISIASTSSHAWVQMQKADGGRNVCATPTIEPEIMVNNMSCKLFDQTNGITTIDCNHMANIRPNGFFIFFETYEHCEATRKNLLSR